MSKKNVIDDVIARYRAASSRDQAFDRLAAAHLKIGQTDLDCLNIIEATSGLTAGQLATESGLTTGAVTAVIDRLDKAGLARRVADPSDRRKVKVEVTQTFYDKAREVWGPLAEDWHNTLAKQFTAAELETVKTFLEAVDSLGERHGDRLRG